MQDPSLVGYSVMASRDPRDQAATEPFARLRTYLADKELLLLLDNCEHLLEAVGELVNEVVRASPGARVMATSREPLDVPGGKSSPSPPWSCPPQMEAGWSRTKP